jgi:hypothetical protein
VAAIINTLRDPNHRVRQPFVNCLLLAYSSHNTGVARLGPALSELNQLLLENALSILDRAHMVLRGKLYLLLAHVFNRPGGGVVLLRAVQLRMFTVLAHDTRRGATADDPSSDPALQDHTQYMLRCADCLLSVMADAVPQWLGALDRTLALTAPRKRPPTHQVREIRLHLDVLPGVVAAISTPIVRLHVFTAAFARTVAHVVQHLGEKTFTCGARRHSDSCICTVMLVAATTDAVSMSARCVCSPCITAVANPPTHTAPTNHPTHTHTAPTTYRYVPGEMEEYGCDLSDVSSTARDELVHTVFSIAEVLAEQGGTPPHGSHGNGEAPSVSELRLSVFVEFLPSVVVLFEVSLACMHLLRLSLLVVLFEVSLAYMHLVRLPLLRICTFISLPWLHL